MFFLAADDVMSNVYRYDPDFMRQGTWVHASLGWISVILAPLPSNLEESCNHLAFPINESWSLPGLRQKYRED